MRRSSSPTQVPRCTLGNLSVHLAVCLLIDACEDAYMMRIDEYVFIRKQDRRKSALLPDFVPVETPP